MTVRPRPLLLACVAVLAVIAGGCGQSEKDKYIDSYRPLNSRLVRLNDDLARTINGSETKTNAELAREFTPLSTRLGALSRDIRKLNTPVDLRQEAKALSQTLDTTRTDVDGVARAARRRDARGLAAASVRLPQEANRISAAANRLARATGARVNQ